MVIVPAAAGAPGATMPLLLLTGAETVPLPVSDPPERAMVDGEEIDPPVRFVEPAVCVSPPVKARTPALALIVPLFMNGGAIASVPATLRLAVPTLEIAVPMPLTPIPGPPSMLK